MSNDEPPTTDRSPTHAKDASVTEGTSPTAELPPDVARTFERVEKLLGQIRGGLDAATRDSEHREFSIGRLVAAILQVIVAGLVALALLDWFLAAPTDSLLVKLAFAAVLQLSALTAFLVWRHSD